VLHSQDDQNLKIILQAAKKLRTLHLFKPTKIIIPLSNHNDAWCSEVAIT